MTFLEKAKEYNKQFEISKLKHICPEHIGLENDSPCGIYKGNCEMCWNREMPNTEPLTENERKIDFMSENAYNQGFDDACKFTKKIWDMNSNERYVIFGSYTYEGVLTKFTPQEAHAKLKAYEEAQIEVGDVVQYEWNKILVTKVCEVDGENPVVMGFCEDGTQFAFNIEDVYKTGKHIDIQSILEQIGE